MEQTVARHLQGIFNGNWILTRCPPSILRTSFINTIYILLRKRWRSPRSGLATILWSSSYHLGSPHLWRIFYVETALAGLATISWSSSYHLVPPHLLWNQYLASGRSKPNSISSRRCSAISGRIGNDLVVILVPPGYTTSALKSIPRLWTIYIKLKIDQHGEVSQRPQGYAIHGDELNYECLCLYEGLRMLHFTKLQITLVLGHVLVFAHLKFFLAQEFYC